MHPNHKHDTGSADGTTLDADIIVLATGYSSMRDSIRDIVGDKVASALPTLWNLDCQRELHTMWRNTGLPGCKGWLCLLIFMHLVD